MYSNILATVCTSVIGRVLWLERLKATHVTLIAVVGRLVFDPTLIGNLLACSNQLVPQDLDVLHGLQQAVSDRKVKKTALM